MTGPIKPPGKPGSVPDPEPGAQVQRGERRQDFDAALPDPASAPAASSQVGPVDDALLAELRAGTLDVGGLVDRLVERALGSAVAAAVAPDKRAELEAFVRGRLAEDPVIAEILRGLERE